MKTMHPSIYDIRPLIARVKTYAKARGCSLTTASFHVFGDGERIKLLEEGKTVTVKTASKAWATLGKLEAELRQAESA